MKIISTQPACIQNDLASKCYSFVYIYCIFFRDFCSTHKIWCVIFVRWMNKYNIKSIAWQIKRLFGNVKMWGFQENAEICAISNKNDAFAGWMEWRIYFYDNFLYLSLYALLFFCYIFCNPSFVFLHLSFFKRFMHNLLSVPSALFFSLLWSIPSSTCIAFGMLWICYHFFLALHTPFYVINANISLQFYSNNCLFLFYMLQAFYGTS